MQPASGQELGPTTREAAVEELIRARCATDGSDVYTTWTGKLYSFVPGERQKLLFQLVGMNVARCWQTDGQWHMATRELMFYLDPESGQVLDRWKNPWTGESVPVVHVANSPVQNTMRGPMPVQLAGKAAIFGLDIPLFYPNALGGDRRFAAHSPAPNYQAGEFFALIAPAHELADAALATVSDLTIVWHRQGPWLPWMKMGDRPGYLVYSTQGSKVARYELLPEVIRQQIDTRLQLYRHAPRCMLDQRNETSWTYFARHYDAYVAGERFPLPAPEPQGGERCRP